MYIKLYLILLTGASGVGLSLEVFLFTSENIIMTVRRYSVSSNILKLGRKNDGPPKGKKSEDKSTTNHIKWARLQDGVHSRPQTALSSPTREEHNSTRERHTNRRSLQDYVNTNR